MKILILGAGAIGSNLTEMLASDLKGEHEIAVVDKDSVEERNIRAGTQFYNSDCIGMPKVDALEYMVYKIRQRAVIPLRQDVAGYQWEVQLQDGKYDLLIDCLDNRMARQIAQEATRYYKRVCLHIGFSDQLTYAIEWDENYKVPDDITSGMDICEMEGAASFVKMVSAIGSQVIQDYIKTGQKREFLGNRLIIREVK